MRKYPNELWQHHLREMDCDQAQIEPGTWHTARPSGFCSLGNRIRCAWLVFTGQADALRWYKQ